jgi:hypothetical protein
MVAFRAGPGININRFKKASSKGLEKRVLKTLKKEGKLKLVFSGLKQPTFLK